MRGWWISTFPKQLDSWWLDHGIDSGFGFLMFNGNYLQILVLEMMCARLLLFFYSNFIFINSKQQNCMELSMNFPRASSPKLSNSCLFVVLFWFPFFFHSVPKKFRFLSMDDETTHQSDSEECGPAGSHLFGHAWLDTRKVDFGGFHWMRKSG